MLFDHWLLAGLSASWSSNVHVTSKLKTARAVHSNLCCCDALKSVLGNKISFPTDQAYSTSVRSYWSKQESTVHPKCVVSPGNAQDVSKAVHTLMVGDKKWPGQCQFAIRGGGHTPFAGAANIQDGITIDLSGLRVTGLSDDHTTVQISPGARWSDVYETLDPLNLSTSGGRVATVGVGGLTTGGGISFFSPRYGFVCDNVKNFQVVLGDGSIVNANKDTRPDLFKSLRGGSNNFGVVTGFDMKVFPQGKWWGGNIVYPIGTRHEHFQAFDALTANPNYDPYAALINSYSISQASPTWIVSNNIQYTQSSPPQPYPPVFRPFTNIRPQTFNSMRVSHLTNFTEELAEPSPIGSRDLFITSSFRNSAAMMEIYFDLANRTVQPLLDVPGLVFSLSFQPLPKIITRKALLAGPGNALGIDPDRGGNMVNFLLTVMWDNAADDAAINAAARRLVAQGEAAAKSRGVYRKYQYLNYAAKTQDPIGHYGEESVSMLRAASRKYDPNGVFQRQVPGGFKLPTS